MIVILNRSKEQMPVLGIMVSVVGPDGKRAFYEGLAVVPDINPMKRMGMIYEYTLKEFAESDGFSGHVVESLERVETLPGVSAWT